MVNPHASTEHSATLALVLFVVVAAVAFGAAVTVSTAALLFALALVPAVLVLALWPGVQPSTASEVIHGTDRRH
jgi:4-hydroxybenzoate polyprenyltransferase